MALFEAYLPEPEELYVLARRCPPELANHEYFREARHRKGAIASAYLILQAYCNRNPDNERYLSRGEALIEIDPWDDDPLSGEWILDALVSPLPDRPPLLHTPGGPGTMCQFKGCLDHCLDESCDCTIGAWREVEDFRVCLAR